MKIRANSQSFTVNYTHDEEAFIATLSEKEQRLINMGICTIRELGYDFKAHKNSTERV